jgi:hypothetical protein
MGGMTDRSGHPDKPADSTTDEDRTHERTPFVEEPDPTPVPMAAGRSEPELGDSPVELGTVDRPTDDRSARQPSDAAADERAADEEARWHATLAAIGGRDLAERARQDAAWRSLLRELHDYGRDHPDVEPLLRRLIHERGFDINTRHVSAILRQRIHEERIERRRAEHRSSIATRAARVRRAAARRRAASSADGPPQPSASSTRSTELER